MLTSRRLLLGLVGVLILAIAWTVWTAWRTERDLRAAESAVERLQTAVGDGDDTERDAAVADLQEASASARERTGGWWWSAMTKVPIVGDDAAGVEALSASIDVVARDAVAPLVATVDSLDGLVSNGRVDPAQVAALEEPVAQAARAMRDASDLVATQDPDDFVSALRTRYADYSRQIADVADDFGAAETAVDVLPAVLGADGPRNYLFVFQNNAEIRSTGGLPGSWARIRVEDGNLNLLEQGSGGAFFEEEEGAVLTSEERAVYGELPALYFQNAGMIPDFPRSAEIFDDFWARKYPRIELDGVVALDPVGMAYLLNGTGPVTAGPLTLSADTFVAELLSNTYLTVRDPIEQDRRFQQVARAVFTATTSQLVSPVDFVRGMNRAIHEDRLLFAPFAPSDRDRIDANAAILGTLAGDDGSTPHVDIGVNDSTGSKMSYYLRYRTDIRGQSCEGGIQELSASMTLNQVISPAAAKKLPDDVTGGGFYGIPVGNQLVTLRIYGPFEGTITDVRIDGKSLEVQEGLVIDGRPVVTVAPVIDTRDDVIVTWRMTTGAGQTGAVEVGVTPSVVPGDSDTRSVSVC